MRILENERERTGQRNISRTGDPIEGLVGGGNHKFMVSLPCTVL